MNLTHLIPHRPPMILLDRVISANPDFAETKVVITKDSLFCDGAGVPAYVGIEYMAQTIAVYSGKLSGLADASGEIGFLLGTRDYISKVPMYPIGKEITIRVEPVLVDGSFGAFRSTVEMDGAIVTSAIINTYKPDRSYFETISQAKDEMNGNA